MKHSVATEEKKGIVFADVIIGLPFYLFITSQEFQWLNFAVGGRIKQILVAIIATLLVGASPVWRLGNRRSILIKTERIYYIPFFVTILYMMFHEVVFRDGLRSVKYSLFFFLALIGWKRTIVLRMAKMFVMFTSIICILTIVQWVLITLLYGGNVDTFPIVVGTDEIMNRDDHEYVNPFGLGFLASAPSFSVSDFEFRRACSYASEPKYVSSVVLISLGVLLFYFDVFKYGNGLIIIHIIAILIIMSGASFIAIVLAIVLNKINRKQLSTLKVVILLLGTLIVLPIVLEIGIPRMGAYWGHRAQSGIGSLRVFNLMFEGGFGLIGAGYSIHEASIATFLLHIVLLRYGWFGLVGVVGVFITYVNLLKAPENNLVVRGTWAHLGISLLLSSYYTYYIIFLPEVITPLLVFAIVVSLSRLRPIASF